MQEPKNYFVWFVSSVAIAVVGGCFLYHLGYTGEKYKSQDAPGNSPALATIGSLPQIGSQLDAQDPPAGHLPHHITNSVGMKFVLIRPGRFVMGSPTTEPGRNADEDTHEVHITKPLYMSIHEVTQAQYSQLMGNNPSSFSPAGRERDCVQGLDTAGFPVESVTWFEACTFCDALSGLAEEQRSGRTYRLPTEAEWEFACRAGTSTFFHFGNSLSTVQANFRPNAPAASLARPAPVGSYGANALGLYDMHGNVSEWCLDWYGERYYTTRSSRSDPAGPSSGQERIARGGSWKDVDENCRSAHRDHAKPGARYKIAGFRVVMPTLGRSRKL